MGYCLSLAAASSFTRSELALHIASTGAQELEQAGDALLAIVRDAAMECFGGQRESPQCHCPQMTQAWGGVVGKSAVPCSRDCVNRTMCTRGGQAQSWKACLTSEAEFKLEKHKCVAGCKGSPTASMLPPVLTCQRAVPPGMHDHTTKHGVVVNLGRSIFGTVAAIIKLRARRDSLLTALAGGSEALHAWLTSEVSGVSAVRARLIERQLVLFAYGPSLRGAQGREVQLLGSDEEAPRLAAKPWVRVRAFLRNPDPECDAKPHELDLTSEQQRGVEAWLFREHQRRGPAVAAEALDHFEAQDPPLEWFRRAMVAAGCTRARPKSALEGRTCDAIKPAAGRYEAAVWAWRAQQHETLATIDLSLKGHVEERRRSGLPRPEPTLMRCPVQWVKAGEGGTAVRVAAVVSQVPRRPRATAAAEPTPEPEPRGEAGPSGGARGPNDKRPLATGGGACAGQPTAGGPSATRQRREGPAAGADSDEAKRGRGEAPAEAADKRPRYGPHSTSGGNVLRPE